MWSWFSVFFSFFFLEEEDNNFSNRTGFRRGHIFTFEYQKCCSFWGGMPPRSPIENLDDTNIWWFIFKLAIHYQKGEIIFQIPLLKPWSPFLNFVCHVSDQNEIFLWQSVFNHFYTLNKISLKILFYFEIFFICIIDKKLNKLKKIFVLLLFIGVV